jgi:hypothetical protein
VAAATARERQAVLRVRRRKNNSTTLKDLSAVCVHRPQLNVLDQFASRFIPRAFALQASPRPTRRFTKWSPLQNPRPRTDTGSEAETPHPDSPEIGIIRAQT